MTDTDQAEHMTEREMRKSKAEQNRAFRAKRKNNRENSRQRENSNGKMRTRRLKHGRVLTHETAEDWFPGGRDPVTTHVDVLVAEAGITKPFILNHTGRWMMEAVPLFAGLNRPTLNGIQHLRLTPVAQKIAIYLAHKSVANSGPKQPEIHDSRELFQGWLKSEDRDLEIISDKQSVLQANRETIFQGLHEVWTRQVLDKDEDIFVLDSLNSDSEDWDDESECETSSFEQWSWASTATHASSMDSNSEYEVSEIVTSDSERDEPTVMPILTGLAAGASRCPLQTRTM